MLYGILKVLAALLSRLLFGLRVTGIEHLPRSGPFLLVANHASLLDPVILGVACPRPLCYLAKAELFRVPVLGWLIRRVNAFPVERDGADPGALRRALALLDEGRPVVMFPEGTRGDSGRLRPGKAGAGMLALRSGVTVVPAYIEGTGMALGRGQRRLRLVRVAVAFGAPVRLHQGGRGKGAYLAAAAGMMEAIVKIRQETGERPGRDSARRMAEPGRCPPEAGVKIHGTLGGVS